LNTNHLKKIFQKETCLKAAVVFAGNWPRFILTTYESFASQDCIEKLEAKGLNNFLAHEVPADLAQKKYG
jgi:hypothetical protein